jgi:hypothetical protein
MPPKQNGCAQGSAQAGTTLSQHEVTVDPFVQWRRGNRAQLVASVSASIRCGQAADVSHLSDAPVFEIGRRTSPDVSTNVQWFDTAARQERVRRRVLRYTPHQIVERFQEIGACSVPPAVVRTMQIAAETGPLSQRGPAIPESWRGEVAPTNVTSFERTKPPSRADALAVARAMQLMHAMIDDAYGEVNSPRRGEVFRQTQSSVTSLRSLLPEPELPGGLSSVLQGLETKWVLEHLAVVDIGFAELIRQVKVQCVERGALLNYVRETLFDYLADFLSSERNREDQIAHKESELRAASSKFDATCQELDEAKSTIRELEVEIRRLETLQKYTIAKHIRDKQRMTRRHERRRSKAAVLMEHHGEQSSSNDEECDEVASDDEEDTLATLVKQKREQEPKVRRASMANPMVVPNSLQHVRERARIRVAESADAAVMTDPVFFRSKLPDSEKKEDPPARLPQPRRERLSSVSLAKNVTHHYTQTDLVTPSQSAVLPTEASDDGDRRGGALEPTVPLGRRPSILNSSQVSRVNPEEIRRRISMARIKPVRLTAVNAGVQATVDHSEASVQNVAGCRSVGTQSSVLLQMHVSGAMQQTPPEKPVTPLQTNVVADEMLIPARGAHQTKLQRQTSPNTSPSSRSPISHVRGPAQRRSSPIETVSPNDNHASDFPKLDYRPSTQEGGVPITKTLTHTQSTQTSISAGTGNLDQLPSSLAVGGTGANSPAKSPQSGRRLAALVKPLVEAELSSLQPSTTLVASSTKTPGGPRLRNLKWMLSSITEVYISAAAARFGPSGDPSTLLVKHFRTKYGFEKVADGYTRDFSMTLEAMFGTVKEEGSHIGTYPCQGGTSFVCLHRRVFAYVQFCTLHANQPCKDLDVNPSFHIKAFLFYLHILESFRIRGGKGFLKDLCDDVAVLLTPRYVLMTLESALKDYFPRPALELFLLAVQGAMNRSMVGGVLPTLHLPAGHSALSDPDYCELVVFAAPETSSSISVMDINLPSWDLDVLLEVLVRGYDSIVRGIITAGQRSEARLKPLVPQTTVVVWNGSQQ